MQGVLSLFNYLVLGAIGLVALFFLVYFIICLCERQHLTGDLEPAFEPFPYPPTPYWKATREDALRIGLSHAGDFATRKSTSIVKGLMSLFISRDRQVFVAVVSGSIAGAKTKKTVLRSKLANGRVIESSDEGGSRDLSGLVSRAMLINAGIDELMRFHGQRVEASNSSPLPFAEALLEDYERIDLDRGARLVQRGLARWADPARTTIRMTARGAFGMLGDMVGQFRNLEGQKNRIDIRRAGSRPGD